MVTMDVEISQPICELRETLIKLRAETDALKDSATKGSDRDQTLATYQTTVLPHLLQLRRLNRLSKDTLEIKHDKVRELNRQLVNMHDGCENITYEVSCLNHEVTLAKRRLSPTKTRTVEPRGDVVMRVETNGHSDMDFFDAEKVGQLDHSTRLSKLEEEEKMRRELQDKLAEITKETNEMESVSKSTEAQLNRIKPYIKQLVDRLDLNET